MQSIYYSWKNVQLTLTIENISILHLEDYTDDAWMLVALRWRHNGRDGVSNHQAHDCFLTFYSDADQRKHQGAASLAFVRGIH